MTEFLTSPSGSQSARAQLKKKMKLESLESEEFVKGWNAAIEKLLTLVTNFGDSTFPIYAVTRDEIEKEKREVKNNEVGLLQ